MSIQLNVQRLRLALSEPAPDWALDLPSDLALFGAQAKAAPLAMRRRMANLSKLVVSAAFADQDAKMAMPDFAVYSSRHGEFSQKWQTADDVLKRQPTSPTTFSQSVHNTSAGLCSIIAGWTSPSITLAHSQAVLASALLNAHLYLQDHPKATVLVVAFDEALPTPLAEQAQANHPHYALAMQVQAGPANLQLDYLSGSLQAAAEGDAWQFMRWWSSAQQRAKADRQAMLTAAGAGHWQWQCL